MSYRHNRSNGGLFRPDGRVSKAMDGGKANRTRKKVENMLYPGDSRLAQEVRLDDGEGIAFIQGTVMVKDGRIEVVSRNGDFVIPIRNEQLVRLEGTNLLPGNISKGIGQKFVIIRHGDEIDISTKYSGIPTLKDHEFGVVL